MKQSHRRSDILPDERADVLRRAQNEKMASSAHAFVRGGTIEFYKWLDQNSIRKLPVAPPVWICGDCHNGNLGPVAGADGSVSVQVRDLDQTVIGNPAHDLIRLGLSIASAVRGSDLPGVTTACMLEEMVVGYETAFTDPNSPEVAELARPDAVRCVMRKAATRSWKHLARERLWMAA